MKAIIAIAAIAALVALSGMAVATERMGISTDKQEYLVGETVTITLTNQCRAPVQLQGFWIEDSTGKCIYTPPMPCFPQYLDPGEEYNYCWDQIDYSGNQVAEGFYSVNIKEGSVRIDIEKDPIVLTTEKDVYVLGESITITLTNQGTEPVTVPGGYSVFNEEGEQIYTENTLAYPITLRSGESLEYIWNQVTDSGDSVAEGVYTLSAVRQHTTVTIIPKDQPILNDSVSETIGPEPVAEDSIGSNPVLPGKLPNSPF